MEGWIKLHRQLLEWEWYDEPDTFRLFLHCLLKANHKDNNYRGQKVKVGSFLTSRELLSNETGLSIQKVRTSLERLELTKEITTKKSKKGTVLQIVKYSSYQGINQQNNQQSNQRFNQIVTNDQPTVNQIVTTNNNDNNDNNEKNENKLKAKPNKHEEVLKMFDETTIQNAERILKTNKANIRIRLEEFLEIEKLTPTFVNRPLGEILKHFRNWLNHNKPREVSVKSSTPAPWLQTPKN